LYRVLDTLYAIVEETGKSVPLMTYQEAADYLRISLATIDRMVRAGELCSVLIRGRRLFRIRDLDEYIRSHSIPGGE
jgi:excisionase family DNA binding protein